MVIPISIKAYPRLLEEIQLLEAQREFPVKNEGVFIAVGYYLIDEWWKSEPNKKKFHKEILEIVKKLKNKELIHEKSKGIRKID